MTVWTAYSMVALAAPTGSTAEISVTGPVSVNGQAAVSNSTIISGSTIVTSTDSTATISIGKTGRVELSGNSNLTLQYTDNSITGVLSSGKVRVTNGAVFDVAVDMRRSSPTHGEWVGQELSADNHLQLWIPPGFAHGFVVLSDVADFLYKTTTYYDPEAEASLRWDDPTLRIDWPLHGTIPTLSRKDAAARLFSDLIG